MKRGFTLIELLVVIAIIAILAAILFPVFAQAKAAAKKSVDLSNMKQIGTSTMLYVDDYDDTLYPHRFNCNTQNDPTLGANATCSAYLDGSGNRRPEAAQLSGGAEQRYYWVYMLYPYTKNYDLFKNPGGDAKFVPSSQASALTCYGTGCVGTNYGGQNSYSHNDAWLSPAGAFAGGTGSLPATVATTSIPRVASTIMIVDGTYYGGVLDVANESGKLDLSKTVNGNGATELAYVDSQGAQYRYYWKNLGGAKWSYNSNYSGYTASQALTDGVKLHGGNLNAQFADGHAKSTPYNRVISDICLWTTDKEGAHPNCG